MPRLSKWIVGLASLTVASAMLLAESVSPEHAVFASSTPIQHLIIIVDENHSFDNYFGVYPTAPGFIALPATPSVDGLPAGAHNDSTDGTPYAPYLLTDADLGPLPHGYFDMLNDANHGAMNGYVQETQRYQLAYRHFRRNAPNWYIGQPMGYYDYRTIGPYWDYAQHYAMADHWFQPVYGPTIPNLMYLVAGRAGVDGKNAYYTDTPYEHFTFTNIGDELTAHHLSWTWYQGGWNRKRNDIMDNPFMFFRNYTLGKYRSHIVDVSQFSRDAAQNRLPAISFIKPPGREDEHPGSDMQTGMAFVEQTVNEVMASKDWSSSAIILTFDESGGWYDHAAPPQVSDIDGMLGDGPRIPMLLISPYARVNYVSQRTYNSDSILKFIEYNWNLPALTSVDATANNLLPMFDFRHPDFTPFYLGKAGTRSRRRPQVNMLVNNFPAAAVGTAAPFRHDHCIYLSLAELDRNLNLTSVHTPYGVRLKSPMPSSADHRQSVDQVFLPNRTLLHNGTDLFVSLEAAATAFHWQLHWVNRTTVQVVAR